MLHQFKGNQEMQQHGSKYFAHRPLPPQTPFQNMVMLHIKLKRIMNVACRPPTPTPRWHVVVISAKLMLTLHAE